MTQDTPRPAPGLLPLDAVLERIPRDHVAVAGVETVPLVGALGRVLAEPVISPLQVPPVAVSAMDGYGFMAPAERVPAGSGFLLSGRVPAGSLLAGAVAAGTAVRIFTGAAVPDGVDTVAMQEDCSTAEDGRVVLRSPVTRGANIRPAGEDVRQGSTVLPIGRRLRAQDIGLAAAVGRRELTVRRRLRVALFSTGDELFEPGSDKPAHGIYDANRFTLGAQLTALGAEVRDLGIVEDTLPSVRRMLDDAVASGADLVVSSGGASVGEEDHVRAAVAALGTVDLWKLAIRPGKPLAIGRIGRTSVLVLPGNPVSALVTFLLVGRPLALHLAGAEPAVPARGLAVAAFEHRKRPGRREFIRVRFAAADADGRPTVSRFPNESSGVLTSMVESHGLVDMPADAVEIRPGDIVTVLPFSGLLD